MTRQATMINLTCKQIQRILDEADWQAVLPPSAEQHCQQCAHCQKYKAQLTNLRGLLTAPPRVAAPADFDIKLRQRIAAHQQPVTWGWRPLLWQSALGATAAIALLFGVLLSNSWYYSNTTTTSVAMESPVTKSEETPLTNSVAPPTTAITTAALPPPATAPPPIRVNTRSMAHAAAPAPQRLDNVEPTIIYGAQPMVEFAAEEEDIATIF